MEMIPQKLMLKNSSTRTEKKRITILEINHQKQKRESARID
jgi:hypothetical protein